MGVTIMAAVELFELLYNVILTIYRSRKECEADAEGDEIIQSKSRQLFATGADIKKAFAQQPQTKSVKQKFRFFYVFTHFALHGYLFNIQDRD